MHSDFIAGIVSSRFVFRYGFGPVIFASGSIGGDYTPTSLLATYRQEMLHERGLDP